MGGAQRSLSLAPIRTVDDVLRFELYTRRRMTYSMMWCGSSRRRWIVVPIYHSLMAVITVTRIAYWHKDDIWLTRLTAFISILLMIDSTIHDSERSDSSDALDLASRCVQLGTTIFVPWKTSYSRQDSLEHHLARASYESARSTSTARFTTQQLVL